MAVEDLIRPVGGYFPQDEQGFVLNPCSREHIPARFNPLLKRVIDAYRKMEGKNLHAVYLRGSVPRGKAVFPYADLDCFAITQRPNIRWEEPTWAEPYIKEMQLDFPEFADIEMMVSGWEPGLSQSYPQLTALIKTQSLCIAGKDLGPALPPVRPGLALCLNYRWLDADLADWQAGKLSLADFCKVLVRSGFELVMEREGKFTTDLYWCYYSFSRHYPHKEAQMATALRTFLRPEMAGTEISKLLKSLAGFISSEFRQFRLFN